MVRTQIICTLGPASERAAMLRQMMRAGMDVVRLNFSHGTHAEHLRQIELIRELNRKNRRHIRILQDLQGYRIRVGRLRGGREVALKKRMKVTFTNEDIVGDGNVIPFTYEGALSDIKPGSFIYIDDGNIAVVVKGRAKGHLTGEVVVPGIVREHKGINIPDVKLRFRGVTRKDEVDIAFGIRHGVDYIAQSFVRDRKDVLQIRDLVKPRLPACKIIAKIENRQGIRNIDEILKVSDGIMVARGDMGVSIPIYEIPIVQKTIIRKCNRAGKFVITATQMLESMVEHIRPTRAEVTDVANAILDGTDFVMLSAETAMGNHPVEAVRMMNQIIAYTEKHVRG